ncbi:hypothetical protein NQ317_010077 [Molorchus minor]|uniref:Uncharacterized protein n=1 Tax=Molorchus minor TaxID=1323400 RepID=A0ABQ9J308_9CUCU|nr:hypothetical protein NQ317_010077 [Molorchus minor]
MQFSVCYKKFPVEKCNLLYTDTDSLVYELQCNDAYEEVIGKDINRFDTSDYPKDNLWKIPLVNKKVPGLMKDENNGKLMTHFVGLRSKQYTYKVEGGEKCKKKSKSVKSNVVKRKITFKDYLNCLENPQNRRKTGELLLHEHKQTILEYQKQLNPRGTQHLRYSIHGYHYTSCCWSSNNTIEGPDTCECCYAKIAEERIKNIAKRNVEDLQHTRSYLINKVSPLGGGFTRRRVTAKISDYNNPNEPICLSCDAIPHSHLKYQEVIFDKHLENNANANDLLIFSHESSFQLVKTCPYVQIIDLWNSTAMKQLRYENKKGILTKAGLCKKDLTLQEGVMHLEHRNITSKLSKLRTLLKKRKGTCTRSMVEITERHINPTTFQRMRVTHAVQVFRNSVAAAIMTCAATHQLLSRVTLQYTQPIFSNT